jgi:uncharacterized protein
MGERTKYTPGTFSWTDLSTTDQPAAKSFYDELFGWQADDMPAGEGVVYSMMSIDGKNVAAIAPQPEQQREVGVPAMWNSYVTVASADAALDKAKQLGATVHAEAFDVFEAGRMGVVQDPQGAFFEVWEPKQHIGASLVNAPGALSWNELASPDIEASAGFYRELFGWTVEPIEGMDMPYMTIKTAAGQNNGGIRPKMEQEPPYWLVYFGADDLDSRLAQASELGGTKLFGPMDIADTGKFAVLQDPQGAVFALYSGHFEP